jgi:hypothetical protein
MHDNIPQKFPEKGFYYHYKHDPKGAVNHYAYEVLGVGHHTEDYVSPEDANLLIYRPLYEAFVYKNGKMFDARPLHMFFETVEKEGKTVLRFDKITDHEVISKLETIRDKMYS